MFLLLLKVVLMVLIGDCFDLGDMEGACCIEFDSDLIICCLCKVDRVLVVVYYEQEKMFFM